MCAGNQVAPDDPFAGTNLAENNFGPRLCFYITPLAVIGIIGITYLSIKNSSNSDSNSTDTNSTTNYTNNLRGASEVMGDVNEDAYLAQV